MCTYILSAGVILVNIVLEIMVYEVKSRLQHSPYRFTKMASSSM